MATVVGVRFKEVGKVYYFDPNNIDAQAGTKVIVETARGVECGEVVSSAHTVSDEEILDAQKLLARTEGIGVEPASAASIAGLKKLVDQGVIDKGETITCVVTGHLLKDPNTAIDACTKPTEVDADIDTLRKILMEK